MSIGKIFRINSVQNTTNNFQVNKIADDKFAQNSFDFEKANPNRPESRSDVLGKDLYCLA